ncbi:hypothetical protein COW64_13325, partial [bacterium (Candidatus Blackallbacteria) CG18_big_fil_WC_8_21_14_2_50_49_26]
MVSVDGNDALDDLVHINSLCIENTSPADFSFLVRDYVCHISNPGQYQFKLVNRTQGESPTSMSAVIAVSEEVVVSGTAQSSPATPQQPVLRQPPTSPDPVSSRVGATRGEFSVSGSGAAEYSIPIMTAPGSGGVVPQLAMQYSSQSGKGPLGLGWSVAGFSTIARCGQTLAQDGYNSGVSLSDQDRFCLDGQRLIPESGDYEGYGRDGTRYRLEIDDFTRVTSFGNVGGGPEYFIVQRKDGSTSTFGCGPSEPHDCSARVDANEAGVVYAWPISRFEDSSGNYISYAYWQPGASEPDPWIEWLPQSAAYTGNARAGTPPFAEIRFLTASSASRSEADRFVMGERIRQTEIITKLQSESDGSLLREYRLTYGMNAQEDNILLDVRECWDEGDASCLAPTVFRWTDGRLVQTQVFGQIENGVARFRGARAGDVTGNGRQEIVFISNSGQNDDADFGLLYNEDLTADAPKLEKSATTRAACGVNASDIQHWALVDLQGSGSLGVAYVAKQCSNAGPGPGIYFHPWDHVEKRFLETPIKIAGLPGSMNFGNTEPRLTAMDVNGDGLSDLLVTRADEDGGSVAASDVAAWVYLNESNQASIEFSSVVEVHGLFDGLNIPSCDLPVFTDWFSFSLFSVPIATVDHSGRAALVGEVKVIRECEALDNPDSPSPPDPSTVLTQSEFDDQVATQRAAGTTQVVVRDTVVSEIVINTDPANPTAEAVVWSTIPAVNDEDDKVIPFDYNQDGYTDYLTLRKSGNQTEIRLVLNNGVSLTEQPESYRADLRFGISGLIQVLDYTGDGYPDLMMPKDNDSVDFKDMVVYPWPWEVDENGILTGGYNTLQLVKPDNGDMVVVLDAFGNGKSDTAGFRKEPGSDLHKVFFLEGKTSIGSGGLRLGRNEAPNHIHRITDGFGAWTEIEYKSIAQRSAYTRDPAFDDDALDSQFPVYDLVIPHFVVSGVESLSPQYQYTADLSGATYLPEGVARTEYYYTGAKIQGGGRGNLGFREIASFDTTNRILTRTGYRQDFPYVGLPHSTDTLYIPENARPWIEDDMAPPIAPCSSPGCTAPGIAPDHAILLSSSDTSWSRRAPGATTGYFHLYRSRIEEVSYSPTRSGSAIVGSEFIKRVVTEVAGLDEYGNPDRTSVAVYSDPDSDSFLVSRKIMQNSYDNYVDDDIGIAGEWLLGRLICSEVTNERPGAQPASVTRRSYFGYDRATGVLTLEVIEPDSCDSQAGYALKTEYLPDTFGNTEVTTTFGPENELLRKSGQRRHLGRFVTEEWVEVESGNEQVTRQVAEVHRDRYGNATQVIDGRGVITLNGYDYSGRLVFSSDTSGAWTETEYRTTGFASCPEPSQTAFVEVRNGADGSSSSVCYDR